MNVQTTNLIELSPAGIRINGESKIVLCASLFYFRIPSALWKTRLEQVKSCGYNCIDVYFPWNFHEASEGEWDFSGERDAESFLRLAAETGLMVVARPGPYICSEWDGGALPAYLYPMEDVLLRDNNTGFLRHVGRWFERIISLLAKYQVGAQGTVICVQLENELDFYGCGDPAGYIAALRDMALSHGVTVPLIACAGQGGLAAASGFAEGVVPTCNFYPYDRDPDFEAKVLSYHNELADMGLPLLVTETNRSHYLLRRLLACGTKLLGPYLQASGNNYGFTNATNNWGKPLAFLASDYDFGGMISPEGIIRPEAYEGRLLSRLIAAYRDSLAEASPGSGSPPAELIRHSGSAAGPTELKLQGGGSLLFIANTGSENAELELRPLGVLDGEGARLQLKPNRCAALPYEVPLAQWGLPGMLLFATSELSDICKGKSKTVFLFHTEGPGEVSIAFGEDIQAEAEGMSVSRSGDRLRLAFDDTGIAICRFAMPDGHVLEIVTMSREQALLVESIDEQTGIVFTTRALGDSGDEPQPLEANWSMTAVDSTLPLSVVEPTAISHADYLEKHGIYRGFAWYVAEWKATASEAKGLLLHKAGDVVSLYDGGRYLGTYAPGGASQYIPLDHPLTERAHVTARTEIWGHSNFDDPRLPGLRLGSMRGLRGLTAVTEIRDLSRNWRYAPADPASPAEHPDEVFGALVSRPIVSFGGWMSAHRFSREWFARSFTSSADCDAWALQFAGLEGTAAVYVNGRAAGAAQPLDPIVDITPFVMAGEAVEIAILLERHLGRSAGRIVLLEGSEAVNWRLTGSGESKLAAHAARSKPNAASATLPVMLQPGGMAWLYGELSQLQHASEGCRIIIDGGYAKVTAFLDGRLIARLWTEGGEARPPVTGGSQNSFYLPGPWLQGEAGRPAELALLLEAVDAGHPAELRAIRVSFPFSPLEVSTS